MARQVNGQLKGAQGKVGDVTYYTMNGQTYARKANTDQTNPQTTAQMSRRVRLANVVAMYRAGIAWSKKSYQNKLRVQSDYNKFVQTNLNQSGVALTREQVELGACVVAPYMITRGSVPSIHCTLSGSFVYTSILVEDSTLNDMSPVKDWASKIVANNHTIQMGDQISVIVYEQKINEDTDIPYCICRSYEVTLDPLNERPMGDYIPSNYFYARFAGPGIVITTSGNLHVGGIAYVVSRNTRRGLEVSTQYITMTNNAVLLQYTSQEQLTNSMLSYGLNPDAFLSPDSTEDAQPTPSPLVCLGLGLGIPSQARNYVQNPPSYFVASEQRVRYAFADGLSLGVRFNESVTITSVKIDTWGVSSITSTNIAADSGNNTSSEKVYYATMPTTVRSSDEYIRKITFLNGSTPVFVIDGFPNGDSD